MITPKFAASQIGRMANLDYFPTEAKARQELIKALGTADNEAVAIAVVDGWIKSENQRPTPADIFRLIEEHKQAGVYWDPPWKADPTERQDPILQALMDRHRLLLALRIKELAEHPELNRMGNDGRKTQTPLRDEIMRLTDKLASAGQGWHGQRVKAAVAIDPDAYAGEF